MNILPTLPPEDRLRRAGARDEDIAIFKTASGEAPEFYVSKEQLAKDFVEALNQGFKGSDLRLYWQLRKEISLYE